MPDRPAVIYQYDGTLEGLLTCVFVIYQLRQPPMDIQTDDAPQEWLYDMYSVPTDPGQAARVYDALGTKVCAEAQEWVRTAFLYGEGGREMAIYRFIRMALKRGAAAVRMFGHPDITPIYDRRRAVLGEAHLLMGFVRFTDLGGLLAAEIRPKHFVLPLLEEHFTGRYLEEQFLIHDQTHGAALAYRPHEARIFFVRDLRLPRAGEGDGRFEALWQGYFRATTIAARANPLCQRTHCPKRYWSCMTEHLGGTLISEGASPRPLTDGADIDKPSPVE